ncbi:MAG: 3'-5' exonuclease [Amoebophilaceae bacterium]|nr:3'-5' exonuclease [Amoebophilaceae bacterium]
MQLTLRNPLAFFDLEATGTNITHDRIVEIAIIKIMPSGERLTFEKRINPEKAIPPEASFIHGICDNDVKDAPSFKMIAKELFKFLQGCDLAGFNVLRFDIPMLIESFLRAGIDFKIENRKVVDAQRIFHLMEKRNLTAAYQFYCRKELTRAHRAMADTETALAVLEAQIIRYANQPVTDNEGKTLGTITNDVTNLHTLTAAPLLDFAGRMVYDAQGTAVFNFGKHKGKPVAQILRQEPAYYDWIMKSDFPLDTKRKLTQIKLQGKK